MLETCWHLLPKNLEDIERSLLISLLILVVGGKELLMRLPFSFLLLLAIAGVAATRWHVELRGSINHDEVILTRVIIHILLYIIVGLLNIIELLRFEVIIVYRGVIVIVILNLDVLGGLSALGLVLNWRTNALFLTAHLGAHVRAWGGGAKDLIVCNKEVVEIILFFQPLFIKTLVWRKISFFIQEVE